MIVVNSDGNTIVLNVNLYNARFWAAIHPFVFERMWPINCAGQFIQGLCPDLRKKIEAVYPRWHQQHPPDSLSQKTALALIPRIAATVELDLESMVGLSSCLTGHDLSVRAYPSQA